MAEMLKNLKELHQQHEQQLHKRMHEYDKMMVALFSAGALLVLIALFASIRHGRNPIAVAVIAGLLLLYGVVLLIRRRLYRNRQVS